MSIFQSERSIPLPVEEILPCVTLPIVASFYGDAQAIQASLRDTVFKGNFNHVALRRISRDLFIASFGRYGEHNLQWEIEKYVDEMKAKQGNLITNQGETP